MKTECVPDHKVPFIIKDVSKPPYMQFITEPVDEESLKIKIELLVKDLVKEREVLEKKYLPKKSVKIVEPKAEPKSDIGKSDSRKKKRT